MKRMLVLCTLLAVGALSLRLAALQAPPAAKVVEVDKVKDNLYILRGGGGNTAVFVTSTGVVLVDTKLAGWGQPILDKVKELTPKPVTTIINTHSHGDHVSGNVEFPATVEIVGHENTAKHVAAWTPVYGLANQFPNVVKDSGGKGIPKRTFKDKMTLGRGADQVDLFYFGRGHTSGDTWIVFPALRVMHVGDIFANKALPITDENAGGSGVDIPDTVAKAHSSIKNVDTIITGHAPATMTMDDLKLYSEFIRDFLNHARDGKKAGKSIDEVAASWTNPAKYTGFAVPQPARVKTNVEVIFHELK
jgi:cyclase